MPNKLMKARKNTDQRLLSERFPRSSSYHPEWVMEGAFGANPLWLAEWLTAAIDLKPGMRVLDLGCGRAKSSVFLRRSETGRILLAPHHPLLSHRVCEKTFASR